MKRKYFFSITLSLFLSGNLYAFNIGSAVEDSIQDTNIVTTDVSSSVSESTNNIHETYSKFLNMVNSLQIEIGSVDDNGNYNTKIGTEVLGQNLENIEIKTTKYIGPLVIIFKNMDDIDNNNILIDNKNPNIIQLNNNTLLVPFNPLNNNINLKDVYVKSITKKALIVVNYLNYNNETVKNMIKQTGIDMNLFSNLNTSSNFYNSYMNFLLNLFKCENTGNLFSLEIKSNTNVGKYNQSENGYTQQYKNRFKGKLNTKICRLNLGASINLDNITNNNSNINLDLNMKYDNNNLNCYSCLNSVLSKYFKQVKSDYFAIRPDKYLIKVNNNEENIKSGTSLSFDIYSLGKNNEIALGYDENANFNLEYLSYNESNVPKISEDYLKNYLNKELDNIKFNNGLLKIDNVIFDNVGKLKYKISENMNGGEYSKIDNDYGLSYIKPAEIVKKYKVAKYNININVEDKVGKNYTLLDNNIDEHYAILYLKLIGKSLNNKITTLLDKRYYVPEKNIKLKLKLTNMPEGIVYYLKNNQEEVYSDKNGNIEITIYNNNWNEGINNNNFKLNFERKYNKYVNEFQPDISTLDISGFTSNELEKNYKINTNFRYGFIYIPDLQVTGNDSTVLINNIKYYYIDKDGNVVPFSPNEVIKLKPVATINKIYNDLVSTEQLNNNNVLLKLNLSSQQLPKPFKITLHYDIPKYLWYQPLTNNYKSPNLNNNNTLNCLYNPCQNIIYTDKKIKDYKNTLTNNEDNKNKINYPTVRINY